MNEFNIAVIGGGSGLSQLLKGLKRLPFNISAIVSVCDDGRSTGRLREEFKMPAMGDIRKVLISLSENESEVGRLFDYRFETDSDLNGHALGNILLTGASKITGNLSGGIEILNSLLKLKGAVLPLTGDNVTLMGKMSDGSVIEGEHFITESNIGVSDVFYKESPKVNPDVIKAIKKADAIVLSMGSLYTSILPNLICDEVKEAIAKSKGKIVYICNIMTQPGETDGFSVSDHIKCLNDHLDDRNVDVVVVNDGVISDKIIKKYANAEQKDVVLIDELSDVDIIKNNYVLIENGIIRHNAIKVAIDLFSYLIG